MLYKDYYSSVFKFFIKSYNDASFYIKCFFELNFMILVNIEQSLQNILINN
jgi:hypothetical protein